MPEEAKKPINTFESEQNLIGLFALLLEVDKRVNPQNYKTNKNQNA